MKKLFPDIALWITEVHSLILFLSVFIGLLPYIPITEDCFSIPLMTPEFALDIGDVTKNKRGGCFLYYIG